MTKREYIEALMHFAISRWQRPGSWEAQGFEERHYSGDEAYDDRWF